LRFVRRQEARADARPGVAQRDGSSQVSSICHGARLDQGQVDASQFFGERLR
jgi:hypothetical protein